MTHDEFIAEYGKLAPRIIELYTTSKKIGLLALEEILDGEKAKQRDIMEYSIRFIVNGMDTKILEKILSNIVQQEDDKYARLLMEIKKEAALSLQYGLSLYSLYPLLNSYTDIPIEDDPIAKFYVGKASEKEELFFLSTGI